MEYLGLEDLDEFRNEFEPIPGKHYRYKGGGGGAPETTTTISKTEPPAYVEPYSVDLMERSGAMSYEPYVSYEGERIAPLTDYHNQGINMAADRALYGSDAINSAQNHAANVFNDAYMNKGLSLASNPNPYMGQANPYSGSNAYMEGMIDKAQGNITENYLDTINPQLAAMERNSGAYGNTGVEQTREKARDQLLEQLSNTENQYRFQDFNQQAQLAESGLNRDSQLAAAQQANMLNTYSNERANQMGAMEFAPQLAEQDYIDAQNLLGVGDIVRNANQQQLDFNYDQWMAEQQHPYQQLDLLANAIRTSMGGGGTNVTSAPNAYQPNSTAQMIGTGLTGYGLAQGLLG